MEQLLAARFTATAETTSVSFKKKKKKEDDDSPSGSSSLVSFQSQRFKHRLDGDLKIILRILRVFVFLNLFIFWNFFPTSERILCAVKNVFTSIHLDCALLRPGNLKNRLGVTLLEENNVECFLCFNFFFFINAKVHMMVIKAV